MQSDNMPDTEEAKQLPPKVGYRDRDMSGWQQAETGELAPGVKVSSGMKVVDIGCGDGNYISFCSRCGADVTFVDRQESKVANLATRLENEANGGAVEGIVSDCDPIPLSDGYADLVISTEVLEHVPDPGKFLNEIVRIGAQDATYCLTVPDSRSEELLKGIAAPIYFSEPNHIHIYSPDDFRQLAENAGLEVIRHEFISGFWSLFNLFKWGTIEPGDGLADASHSTTYHWSRAWEEMLNHPNADKVRDALNRALPRTQVIVARRK